MNAVVLGAVACRYTGLLRQQLQTPWELSDFPAEASSEELAPAVASADAVICLRYRSSLPPAPRLKLIQVAAAGFEGVDLNAVPPGVTVCNSHGHEQAIGEYVVMALLAWRHRFLELERSFRSGSWAESSAAGAPFHQELAGAALGVLGLGRIGREVARRGLGVQMRVVAWNRTARRKPAGVQRLYSGFQSLPEFLSQPDFLVVCCALTDETRGLLDRQALSRMRREAVLVNVARGPVVDQDALYQALSERTIGGAILDVWYRYPSSRDPAPAPARHPFHTLENVVMTPHSSAWTEGMARRRSAAMAANLDRLARGEPLQEVVFPRA